MLKKKIILPYVDIGSGHKSFAASIQWYLKRKRPSWDVRLFEPGKELLVPEIDRLLIENWKKLLALPSFLTRFLFFLEKLFPRTVAGISRRRLAAGADKAAGFLLGFEPDFIMCTHWGCATLFDIARNRIYGNPPVRYIFTELGGAYSPIKCGADIYYALCGEAADDLLRLGVPRERIRPVSFVIAPHLKLRSEPKIEARRRIGIDPGATTILLSLGGEGLGPIMRFLGSFLELTAESRLIVLTGKNRALLERINARFSSERIIPFGFLDSVETVMSAADIFAGKSGTSFTLEAASLKKPLAVIHLGAPNEEHNMKYIVDRGFGWYTPTPRDFGELIARIEQDPSVLAEKIAALEEAISDVNGAEEIADDIIAELEGIRK